MDPSGRDVTMCCERRHALLKLVLGNGTIYKVSYGARRVLFDVPLGRGCVNIDPRRP